MVADEWHSIERCERERATKAVWCLCSYLSNPHYSEPQS